MKADDAASKIFSQTCVYSSKSICVNKLSLLLHLKTFSRKLSKTNPSFFDFSLKCITHTIKSEKVWHKVVILVDELYAIHAVSNKQFEASPSPPPLDLIHCLPPRRNIRLKVDTVSWMEYFWEGFTSEHAPPTHHIPYVWGWGNTKTVTCLDNTLEVSSITTSQKSN